jgi:hypothetical protein
LEKLGFAAGACSLGQDRGHPALKAEGPLPDSTKTTGFPSFRAIHTDVLKGMISYRIWLSEYEHKRASNGQHVQNGLFNESFPTCQGEKSGKST